MNLVENGGRGRGKTQRKRNASEPGQPGDECIPEVDKQEATGV
jgi:hypothetical protein